MTDDFECPPAVPAWVKVRYVVGVFATGAALGAFTTAAAFILALFT